MTSAIASLWSSGVQFIGFTLLLLLLILLLLLSLLPLLLRPPIQTRPYCSKRKEATASWIENDPGHRFVVQGFAARIAGYVCINTAT
jgi:uncharacterized protein HemY